MLECEGVGNAKVEIVSEEWERSDLCVGIFTGVSLLIESGFHTSQYWTF